MKLRPNHLTLLSLILGVFAVFLPVIPALVFFSLSFVLDVFDGKLARKNNLSTKFGGFFDSVSDKIVEILFIYYIVNLMNLGRLGVLVAGSSILTSYIKHRANIKGKIKSILDRPERMIYLLSVVIIFLFTGSYAESLIVWFLIVNSLSQAELFFRIKRLLK